MNRWAAAALGQRGEGREIAVRVVAAQARAASSIGCWRGKDKPTNVLSFPAPREQDHGVASPGLLPAARRPRDLRAGRAAGGQRDGKTVAAHWAHMVIHGALHLAGYDHETGRRERLRMERREIAVLRRFGIGNPYT